MQNNKGLVEFYNTWSLIQPYFATHNMIFVYFCKKQLTLWMQTSFKRKSSEPILEPNSELSNLYGHHFSIRSNLAPVLPNQPPLVTAEVTCQRGLRKTSVIIHAAHDRAWDITLYILCNIYSLKFKTPKEVVVLILGGCFQDSWILLLTKPVRCKDLMGI